jgi:hypothetical protein
MEQKLTELDKRLDRLFLMQEANTKSIAMLIEETRGVIELYNNLKGATAVGISVQNFGLWLIKWPLIGMGLYTAFNWVLSKFPG